MGHFSAATKNANHIPEKHGMTYEAAMEAAYAVAHRAARRHARWVPTLDRADLLNAAFEGVLKAWVKWPGPETVSWEYTAWCYAELGARREANRLKSVVTTGSGRYGTRGGRRGERDESMLVRGADGEWTERDFADPLVRVDEQMEIADKLREVMVALREAIPTVAAGRDGLAREVITQRIATDAPVSAATIAARHGITGAYVYKIENALRAAAGI